MADVQIKCVTKVPRINPHEGITHLGGTGWCWTRADVIASIERRTNTFYTLVGENRADVLVVEGPGGKYVRTIADGKLNDNLLSLPEC